MSRDKQNKKNCVNCIHNLVCEKLEEFRDPLHWVNTEGEFVCSYYDTVYYDETSEVAEKIFAEIEKQLARYSHLHRYAEEAREVTEEYADGTPCEMTSVWEAISLHKNGWDDYETMCKLQDNIGNIEKSRLLKEFEGDIAELKKKYTEEGK